MINRQEKSVRVIERHTCSAKLECRGNVVSGNGMPENGTIVCGDDDVTSQPGYKPILWIGCDPRASELERGPYAIVYNMAEDGAVCGNDDNVKRSVAGNGHGQDKLNLFTGSDRREWRHMLFLS
jgi:hypothetical protein